MTLQTSCIPSATGSSTEGNGAGLPHSTALDDASTCSVVEDWLTQRCAVQEVLAAIPCPTVWNACATWLSKGSRQGLEIEDVNGVGTQLPTKRNFCLQHSPKKVSAYLMDSI